MPDTGKQWSRDQAVAKLLAGAAAAGLEDGAAPGPFNLITGTGEMRFGDQTYVITITEKTQ